MDSILKSRDITLWAKVRLVKAMVFPVVMYGCDSWTVKKAECRIIDAFELWCWRRLLSPFDCKEIQPVHPKGDQSWVFIGRTDAEAETPNTSATWCEELTHWKRPWCWEGLRAGGEGDNRGWDGWMASPTRWTWVWVNFGSWWWTRRPGVLQFMGLQRVGHDWATELNWDLSHVGIACQGLAKVNGKWQRTLGLSAALRPCVSWAPLLGQSLCFILEWRKQQISFLFRVTLPWNATLAQGSLSRCPSGANPIFCGGTHRRREQPRPPRGDTQWPAPSSAGGHAVSPTPAYWAEDFTSHDSAQGKNLGWLFPGPWTHHTEMSPLIACTLSWRRRREIKFWLSHSFINNTVIFITLWIIFSYHFGLTGGGKKKSWRATASL